MNLMLAPHRPARPARSEDVPTQPPTREPSHEATREPAHAPAHGQTPAPALTRQSDPRTRSSASGDWSGSNDSNDSRGTSGCGTTQADAVARQVSRVLHDAARQPRDFLDVHVYGGKAALCFSADETSAGCPTVRIEAAPALGGRRYDWAAKIAFQATSKELPQLLAVLMNWAPAVVFKNHGPAADKGLKMELQGANVFCGLWQARRALAVPVTAPDAWAVTDLIVRQLRRGSPHLSADAVLAITRSLGARMSLSAAPGSK